MNAAASTAGNSSSKTGIGPPIKAVWCPRDRDCAWAYETELPHAEFRVMENAEVYCYGIVCDLSEKRNAHTNVTIAPTAGQE